MEDYPVDPPQEVLIAVQGLLNKDGEIWCMEVVNNIVSLMKACHKSQCRCAYLRILLQTKSHDILRRFICVGGYSLLNLWLTSPSTTQNTTMLKLILLTLKKLPLTVNHLKENNTGRLVKRLIKRGKTEELKKLASDIVDQWKAMIHSQPSSSHTSHHNTKKRKKGDKVHSEVKRGEGAKSEQREKKRNEPLTHPSHAKLPCTDEGLGLETKISEALKKPDSDSQSGDKSKTEPAVFDSHSFKSPDAPPEEGKYKPLIRDLSSGPLGFIDPYSAPQIRIMRKEPEAASPTSEKASVVPPVKKEYKPLNRDLNFYKKNDSAELLPGSPSFSDLPKFRVKKSQAAPAMSDRTSESENVMKSKASEQALVMDSQTSKSSPSYDTMEEKVPWRCPHSLTLPPSLISPGVNSTEKVTQREREMGVLQKIFVSHEWTPSSPRESYDYKPPKAIPLDCISEDSDDSDVGSSCNPVPPGPSSILAQGHKLPPVLTNLMANLAPPPDQSPGVNAQVMFSTMISPGDQEKEPEFCDKVKQLLTSLFQKDGSDSPVNILPRPDEPHPPTMSGCLFSPGANSTENLPQRDSEMGVFLEMQPGQGSKAERPQESHQTMAQYFSSLVKDCNMMEVNNMKPAVTMAQICPPSTPATGSKQSPALSSVMESPAHSLDTSSSDDWLKQTDLYDKILSFLRQNQGQNPALTSPPVGTSLIGHGPDIQPQNMNNVSVHMPMSGGVYPPNQLPYHVQYHPQPPHCHGPISNTHGGPSRTAAFPPPAHRTGLRGHSPDMNINNMQAHMPMNVGYTANQTPRFPQYNHLPHPHSQRPRFDGPQWHGAANGNYYGKDCPGPRSFPQRPGPYWGSRSQCRPNREGAQGFNGQRTWNRPHTGHKSQFPPPWHGQFR